MNFLPDDLLFKISKSVSNFKDLNNLKKTCKTFNTVITKFNIKIKIFDILYKKSISKNRKINSICINSNCDVFVWKSIKFNNNLNLYIPYCHSCSKKYIDELLYFNVD